MSYEILSFERVGLARRSLLENLRQRCAAERNWPEEEIVLLPSPEIRNLIGQGDLPWHRIGPVEAPITLVRARAGSDLKQWEITLSDSLIRAGLDALSVPARTQARKESGLVNARAESLRTRFSEMASVETATWDGARLTLDLSDVISFEQSMSAAGIKVEIEQGQAIFPLATADDSQRLAERIGVPSDRSASRRRTTRETDIFVSVDLGREAPVRIGTGVEFFDHMLEQIARHAGISLIAVCEGDTGIDGHHTIEDVSLALGEALADALGDRKGIGRFGFELPMDETRAGVWIDLSGRPFLKFQGDIPGDRVGEFPVEMTPHVFRSLADSLKAAIHVEVKGENAHHMIEACFKTFGRALRQAIRVEGDAIPSTKGVL